MDKQKTLPARQATSVLSVNVRPGSLVSRGLEVLKQFDEDAHDDNNAVRQWELGCEYMKGSETERDYERAFYWFCNAAEQGHAEAQFALGTLYRAGNGVQQNDELAILWYRKAAAQGHAWARRMLGEVY